MDNDRGRQERVQVEISLEVLCRLLKERSIVASEVTYLNSASFDAGWLALKCSVRG